MAIRLIIVSIALGGALVRLPAGLIERWYSSGVYLAIQPAVTSASNRTGVALFDALVCGTIGLWMMVTGIDLLRYRTLGVGRVVRRVIGRTLVWASVLYIAFLGMWGLNYRREPLRTKVRFDASRITPERARALLAVTVDRLNALHDQAHERGWRDEAPVDPQLADAFGRILRRIGVAAPVQPGRPKRTLFDWYFRRAAVQGMTDPYFLETLVNAELLPFERPLVVAHEWAHLAGFADEGEANFVGWLTCLDAGAADAYSAWLFLYGEAARSVAAEAREQETARLSDGPRDDLRAVAERVRRQTSPRLSAASWRAYDRYLRANRVEAGAASYGQVVQLILGTGSAGV